VIRVKLGIHLQVCFLSVSVAFYRGALISWK